MINNNSAGQHGGGLYSFSNVITIAGTVISNNAAGVAGDAIYASDGLTSLRNVTIASSNPMPYEAVYAENWPNLLFFDTTITNHAVGVARSSNSWLGGNHNALFSNGVDQTVDSVAQPLPFANVVTTNPQFVDAAAGNFHLKSSSPLIDAGDPK